MRKTLLPAALVLAVLTACSDQAPTEVLSGLDLSMAQKVVDNSGSVEFELLFPNPCEDELVLLEGTNRFRVTVWDNGHSQLKLNVTARGVGLDSGLKYNANQQTNRILGPGGLPGVFEVSLHLVSATNADNFFATTRFHVNEHGDVTVGDGVSAECRG